MDKNRPWTIYAMEAEYDAFGMGGLCAAHNAIRAERNALAAALRKIATLRAQHNLSPSVRLARAIVDAEGVLEAIEKETKDNDR